MENVGDLMNQIGVGGIVAIMVVRDFLGYLKSKNKTEADAKMKARESEVIPTWQTEIHQISSWVRNYAKLDSKVLEQVSDTLKTQMMLLQEMILEMKLTRNDVEQIKQNERK